MARTDPQLNLRLPGPLKAGIEDAARVNNRTITAEVVDRLNRSFAVPSQGLSEQDISRIADAVALRLAR